MVYALFLVPFLMAGIAFAVPSNHVRPLVLPLTAILHFSMTVVLLIRPAFAAASSYLFPDPVGSYILLVVSLLYLICAFYTVGYLRARDERSNRVFVTCLSAFIGVASVVSLSQHLGLTWVAIEAITLVTAPLIYFNHTKRSIEATWKYLLIGSVGIALALLGTMFMAYSMLREGVAPSLNFEELLGAAPSLSKPWLRASFILLLIGYGTKMGLAPMQTWKPDAYGEAPGVVGAILSGGMTSLAFLAFIRIYQICLAAGEGAFVSRLLLFMGLFSMAVAGAFMMGQKDFKRMLAYSSVEHMGILMIGLGIGAPALFGTLLHVMTNATTKGVLFLSAGNIQRGFGSKSTEEVSGAIRRLPLSGSLFLAGFIAITGSPPFGPFVSEFSILTGAFITGKYIIAGLFLFFLLIVFIGMGKTVLRVVLGEDPLVGTPVGSKPAEGRRAPYRETFLTAAPLVVSMMLVLVLGLYLPPPLRNMIDNAVLYLENLL